MWRKRRKKGSLWQIRWWRIPSSSSSYCGSHSIECLEVWKAPFALKFDPISPEKWISGIKSRRLPPAKRPTTSNLTLVRRFPHRYHSSDRPKNKTKVCMLTFLHTRMTHWKFTSAVQYFLIWPAILHGTRWRINTLTSCRLHSFDVQWIIVVRCTISI